MEKTKQKLSIIHNKKYDYSLMTDSHYKSIANIICPIHGVFEQKLSYHLRGRGCSKCGEIKKANNRSAPSQKAYIDKCKKQHPHFDYSKTKYIRAKHKVTITCGVHGDWETDPSKFLISVIGCPECSRLVMVELNKKEVFGWTKEIWKKKGESAKRFDSFKAYVIKCWNDDEVFYKIGKTYNKLKRRFSCYEDLPYKFEAVHIFEFENAFDAHDKEIELKKLNETNKYIPKLKFSGMNECFNSVVIS